MNTPLDPTVTDPPTRKGLARAITTIMLASLLGCLWVTQEAQAVPIIASAGGEIEKITINDINDHWSGGVIVAGGQNIIIPKNLQIDLPANRLTLKQLFDQASASCKAAPSGGETGLAKSDKCNLSGSGGIATIAGTRLDNGNVIAGDVLIEKAAESLIGQITYINYTDGYFRVNGKIDGTDSGGIMVRLNDPNSRHTIQQGLGCAGGPNCSPDPRFTLDGDNYTNVFSTGYPLCIPSTVSRSFPNTLGLGVTTTQAAANGSGDVLCPQTNRPAVNVPVPDSRRFAPIKIGDGIMVEGNYETINGTRFLSAHSTAVSAALSTSPGQPDYLFLDEVEVDAAGFQNQRARSLIIGYATLAPADIMIWTIHYDGVSNAPHEFPLATTRGCDIAAGVGTCTAQGLVAAGANIFKIRHDVDFIGLATKPRWDPCAHLRADPRFDDPNTNGPTICPSSDGTGNNVGEQFAILSPTPHEIQARTGAKFADMQLPTPQLITVDIRGNEATNGQYLFPFGMGLGGVSTPEMNEINLDAMGTPLNFTGLPWNLDRRLGPGGCLDTTNDNIDNPACESGAIGSPQFALQPFPFEGATMDPRIQASVPTTPHIDTNYVSGSFPAVRNRILSYVNPSITGRNNGIGVNNEGNFTSTILTWNAPAVVTPPAATAIGGGVIGATPIVNLAQVGGLICNAGGATGFNSPPVAVNDAANVVRNLTATNPKNSVTISVLQNDSDLNASDILSISAVGVPTAPTKGTATIVGTTIRYTPNNGATGSDTFSYTITDGLLSATANVTVTITTPGNGNPNGGAGGEITLEDTPVDVHPLEYATDPDVGDILTVTSVGTPANGTVTLNGSVATYVPKPNFNGTDTFTYLISDNNGGTGTGIATVNVTPVNDVPVAANDTVEVTAGTTIAAIPVLANDLDIDGDALTVSAVTAAAPSTLGTVSRNATTGVVSFVAKPNVTGNGTFNYTISDGHGATATASVTVTVKAVVVDAIAFSAQPEFRTTKSELRAAGTGSTDGKTITLRLGTSPTGTIVGTAPVTLGLWTIRVTGISLAGNSQVTAWSSGGGKTTPQLLLIRN